MEVNFDKLVHNNDTVFVKGSNGTGLYKFCKNLEKNMNLENKIVSWIFLNYVDYFQPLNVFRYITFRTGGATLTALIISFLLGPFLIQNLKKFQSIGQPIRDDGPTSHLIKKKGTPTMGGLLILFAFLISTILWSKLDNILVWIILITSTSFGLIGLYDDWLKVRRKSTNGLKGKYKLILQILIALIAVYLINEQFPINYTNNVLFIFKNYIFE